MLAGTDSEGGAEGPSYWESRTAGILFGNPPHIMDTMTPEQRHRCMSHIRSTDTKPELRVRRIVRELGYPGYRLHVRGLPGSPDIVFKGRKIVLFVNGCFWHGHSCLGKRGKPATHKKFWTEKITRNKARDKRVVAELRRDGWHVMTIWECELKNEERLRARLDRFLKRCGAPARHPPAREIPSAPGSPSRVFPAPPPLCGLPDSPEPRLVAESGGVQYS